MREKVVLRLRSMSDPAKSIAFGRVTRLLSHKQVSTALWWGFSLWQVFSYVLNPPSWGQPACFGRGCASPAGPVLSPLLLLPATQLRVSFWAAAELVPDISNGPIMPDVFTAFGRK